MSSTPFSTELIPDSRLRQIVLATGVLMFGAGVLVIATLPLAALWRWPGAGFWAVITLREILVIASGYKRYRRIRIDSSGAIELQRTGGDWMAVEIQPGSVVLHKLAWLRFRFPDGSRCAELLRGDRRENEDWRRLQLIWRHLGGTR